MAKLPPNSINLNVRGMKSSATVAINELSDELRRQGKTVYKLGLGQSPFPVPEPVVEALRHNAHQKDYLPVRGLRSLRDAVADYHNRRHQLSRSGDDVLIGPGSKELMFLLQLVYYGDLIIPSPSWVSYAPQAQIIGRRVRYINTIRSGEFRLTPERLQAACADDPDRPSLMILNYPNNPTGASFDTAQLEGIAKVAREHGVLLLSDEIYGEVHHRGGHVSVAEMYPEGTIISGGLSKWCGAGGWRLGTFLFPPQLRWLLDAMAAAASETYTSTSAPIQYAAVTAYQPLDAIETYLNDSRRVLGALGRWCYQTLKSAGAVTTIPEGGFYLFSDASDLRDQLGERGVTTSAQLCRKLLQDTGVAVLPGSDFGRPEHELTMRIAYVDFDGARALAGAAAVSGDLDADFLKAHCGGVVEAITRMVAWLTGDG